MAVFGVRWGVGWDAQRSGAAQPGGGQSSCFGVGVESSYPLSYSG